MHIPLDIDLHLIKEIKDEDFWHYRLLKHFGVNSNDAYVQYFTLLATRIAEGEKPPAIFGEDPSESV